jgi:hypothetical protein
MPRARRSPCSISAGARGEPLTCDRRDRRDRRDQGADVGTVT